MEVSANAQLGGQDVREPSNSAKELSEQFLYLLVAQLKNQDPLEPMKNQDFVSELAQLEALDQSAKLTESNRALLLQSSLASGAGLIGKEITGFVTVEGERLEINGAIKSLRIENGEAVFIVEGEDGVTRDIDASNILSVRVPAVSI